jgi:hypothetical protein
VLARVLLAQDRPGPALTLQRVLDAAASQGRTGTTIEIQALAAPIATPPGLPRADGAATARR